MTHLVEAGEAVARARELILAITPAGRALVAEALRLLRFGAVAGGSAAIEAWCSERMTADVVKRRAAGSP